MVDIGAGEEAFGHGFVASLAEISPAEISTAHMHADVNSAGQSASAAVDGIDVAIDQRIGIAARALDLRPDGADRRAARWRLRRAGYSGSRRRTRSAISSR